MDWERYVVFVEAVRHLRSEAARFLDRYKAMGGGDKSETEDGVKVQIPSNYSHSRRCARISWLLQDLSKRICFQLY